MNLFATEDARMQRSIAALERFLEMLMQVEVLPAETALFQTIQIRSTGKHGYRISCLKPQRFPCRSIQ